MNKSWLAGSVVALLILLFARPAVAQFSYEVTLQADYGPSGGCFTAGAAVECSRYFTNLPATGYYNPIEGFTLGQYSSIDVGVVGRSGPIKVERSQSVSFGFLVGDDLAKAYVASDGSRTVSSGFESAVAHAYPARVQLRVDDTILGTIPDRLDGQDVFLKITLPVTLFGDGSSVGALFFRLGSDRQTAEFGSPNVTGPAYSLAETFELTTLVRSASSSARDFAVPFSFYGSFLSSSNNGPGSIDALNSVGFVPDLSSGLSLSSASGLLDPLLAKPVATVPEPQGGALMFVGLVGLLGLAAHHRGLAKPDLPATREAECGG